VTKLKQIQQNSVKPNHTGAILLNILDYQLVPIMTILSYR